MKRFVAAFLLSCVAWPAEAQAPAPKPARVALVIGNAAYPAAPLANPVNDAADMAKELQAAGFTVIRRDNATLREMHLALREFGDQLGKTSTGLFYFAGHGVQVRGRNYLLPVDADIAREDEVAFSALDLAAVMEKLDSARNPVNIVVLDACRDNPFGSRFQASAKGLAQIEAPPGTIIAFSTAPGSAAADGGGRNGLYTGHLLAEMKKPGPSIEETFRAVRASVRRDSKGAQVPWESTSLESEFKFHAAIAKPAPTPAPKLAAGNSPRRLVSMTVPPALQAGDTWTYRITNMLDQSETKRIQSITQVKGEVVHWSHGGTGDLLGNYTLVGGATGPKFKYTPSTHHFVFPLRTGAVYDLAFAQESPERSFDAKVKLSVGPEEELETLAGKLRTIKVVREVKWRQRGHDSKGTNLWTYWYSPEAKRLVRGEQTNTTSTGKVLLHERWELESFSVK
ncbi:MAG TPA: caspase family protein [Usitatibacter sp.]|nr:caspase family protein [Usitatibacter sp.]